MNKDFLASAQRATEEGWDAFRIMAEFMSLQKEADAKIAEGLGATDVALAIRGQ